MHKILVTGASGFIGKALCRRILAEGWEIRGAIRSLTGREALPSETDIVEIQNIGPDTVWKPVLDGVDAVVHLAARVHVMNENAADPITEYRTTNVAGTRRLAQAAVSAKVRRLIYVSSIKVNGEGKPEPYSEEDQPDPIDPYGISKLEAEQELQRLSARTGLEVVILRPPLVYGPGVKANFLQLIKMIDRGIPLPLAGIKNQRSFIYLENFIDAVCACIRQPEAAGQTFMLSDGTEVSTTELIQEIGAILGKPARLVRCPQMVLKFLAGITGKSDSLNRLLNSLIVDSSKIRTMLGWRPPFSMQEGLKNTVRWYQREPAVDR